MSASLLVVDDEAINREIVEARHVDEYRGVMGLIDEGVFRLRSLHEARALAGALASMCRDSDAAGFGLLELLVNAVEHGNLGIRFEDKSDLLAAGRWEQEVAARLALPENARKFVEVRCLREQAQLCISIRDGGAGFDWRGFLALDESRAFLPNGRGIALAREVAFDSMEYAGPGNQVEVTLPARAGAQCAPGGNGRNAAQAELDLATALMGSILRPRQGLRDPALAWAVIPSHRLSADVVAAGRTPRGRLLAMLADATGHGLPAAISLLPVLEVFYGALPRDPPVSQLVAGMNSRLREYAPAGLFLAAVVLGFDPATGQVEVWNGGLPGGLRLHPDDEVATEELASRHLPLGVLNAGEFDGTCAGLCAHGGELIFFSDGLIEAASPQGEPFGAARLRAHLCESRRKPGGQLDFQGVLDAVAAHRAGAPAHDDISLMAIALDARAARHG